MSFHDIFKDAEFEFNDDSSSDNLEAIREFRRRISEPALQEALEAIFTLLRMYYNVAEEMFDEDIASSVVLMVFQHWLETGSFS